MKEWMKSFHEILPGFSPCRNSQHPCWSPTSLHDLQGKNQNEEQPLTERLKDPERQLLKPSLQTLNCCSHKPAFCPLIIHQHVHEQLLFTAVCRKQLSTGKPKSFCVWVAVFNFPVCCFLCNAQGRAVKSSEQCWLHISRHLESLALRRQLTYLFLKPLQAGYPKKPLITTINLVLILQVVSRNLGSGDQRDHKHRD